MVPPVLRLAAEVWVSVGVLVLSRLFHMRYCHWPTVALPVKFPSRRNQAFNWKTLLVRTVPPAALVKISLPAVLASTFPLEVALPTIPTTLWLTVGVAVK